MTKEQFAAEIKRYANFCIGTGKKTHDRERSVLEKIAIKQYGIPEEEAEDLVLRLVTELFAKKKYHEFRGDSSILTWLVGSLKFTALQWRREQGKRRDGGELIEETIVDTWPLLPLPPRMRAFYYFECRWCHEEVTDRKAIKRRICPYCRVGGSIEPIQQDPPKNRKIERFLTSETYTMADSIATTPHEGGVTRNFEHFEREVGRRTDGDTERWIQSASADSPDDPADGSLANAPRIHQSENLRHQRMREDNLLTAIAVQEALKSLPPDIRYAVREVYMGGATWAQVANELNVEQRSLQRIVKQYLAILRVQLSEFETQHTESRLRSA